VSETIGGRQSVGENLKKACPRSNMGQFLLDLFSHIMSVAVIASISSEFETVL